ncbi:hypothetical protein LCGC14_3068340, partial [marine sediment metagenome]
LGQAPHRVLQKLVDWGVLEPHRLAAARPLRQHVKDWKAALLAKGNTEAHVELVVARVNKIIKRCRFRHYADISASRVQRFLADRRAADNMSAQTSNFHLQAAKQFCRWMILERRASENPLGHLSGVNVRTDRRHDRRALTIEEIHALLQAAEAGPTRFKTTGPERAMIYRLALETGLRANEIRSLTRQSFQLDNGSPTVTVEAGYSKRRREDVQPLRPATAILLEQHLAHKMPDAPAFNVPRRTAQMIRADLKDAGIPYRNSADRCADFHALRHTFITNLAQSGAHPSVAQALARHSTIALTMNRYTHTIPEQLTDALDKLPDLTAMDCTNSSKSA